MFNLPQAEAWRRLEKLNEILEENCRRWTSVPITVTVSYGVAGFNSLTGLGDAIETADKAMYAQRNQTRGVYDARFGRMVKTDLKEDLICS
jgi:GGDEF domain-containing protein